MKHSNICQDYIESSLGTVGIMDPDPVSWVPYPTLHTRAHLQSVEVLMKSTAFAPSVK